MSSPSPTVIFAIDLIFLWGPRIVYLKPWSLKGHRKLLNSQHDLNDFSGDYKSFSFNTEDANHNWKNMDENFASQCKCPKTNLWTCGQKLSFSTLELNILTLKRTNLIRLVWNTFALTSIFPRVGPRWWNSRSWSLPFLPWTWWFFCLFSLKSELWNVIQKFTFRSIGQLLPPSKLVARVWQSPRNSRQCVSDFSVLEKLWNIWKRIFWPLFRTWTNADMVAEFCGESYQCKWGHLELLFYFLRVLHFFSFLTEAFKVVLGSFLYCMHFLSSWLMMNNIKNNINNWFRHNFRYDYSTTLSEEFAMFTKYYQARTHRWFILFCGFNIFHIRWFENNDHNH